MLTHYCEFDFRATTIADSIFKKRNLGQIKPGDVFAFRLGQARFGFGRIVSRIEEGHVAEIFKHFSDVPELSGDKEYERFAPPVVLDA
jgi:Immunity protein 26